MLCYSLLYYIILYYIVLYYRYFWSCPTPRVKTGSYSQCDFFQWDDEVLAEQLRADYKYKK